MQFVNFVLNHSFSNFLGAPVSLFRLAATEVLGNKTPAVFSTLFQFTQEFSVHLLIDDSVTNEADFNLLLERILLITGRENYYSQLQKKVVFLSWHRHHAGTVTALIFKLRSLSPKINFLPVRYNTANSFTSSVNVCAENEVANSMQHFQTFVAGMIRKKILFEPELTYFILSEQPVATAPFNQALAAILLNSPDVLLQLNNAAAETGTYKELINSAKKENAALLNAVTYLKKEVQLQYQEREGVHRSAKQSEEQATLNITRRVEEIRKKYYQEYEALPVMYKKFGAMLKILSGKKEISYYLSKRQKQSFFDLLQSLPQDKQIEMWYYYEFEILPNWYKKFAKLLPKNNNFKQ